MNIYKTTTIEALNTHMAGTVSCLKKLQEIYASEGDFNNHERTTYALGAFENLSMLIYTQPTNVQKKG